MENSNISNQSSLKIESIKDFGADDINWDEQRGVVVLPDNSEYRVVIAWKKTSKNVTELDKSFRDAIVNHIKEIFKETKYRFTDLDQVKILKNSLVKGDAEIAQLPAPRVKKISLLFSQVIQTIEKKEKKDPNPEKRAIKQSKMESQRVQKYTEEIIQFTGKIKDEYNLCLEKIDGGGNCLFEAALKGLKKNGKVDKNKTVSQFRKEIVTELEKEEYKKLIQDQIVNDIINLRENVGDQEKWVKGLAGYGENSPLSKFYESIVPLVEAKDPLDFEAIKQNAEEGFDDPIKIYLQTMGMDKIYGGDIELVAIQNLHQISIRLFDSKSQNDYRELSDRPYDKKPEENLHLLFLGRHYDLLVPKHLIGNK